MNDEKKKLIVLVALFVVIIAVGAFQMVGSSKGGPMPPVAEKKKVETKEKTKPALKNPEVGFELAARDPFEAPGAETPKSAVLPTPSPIQTPTNHAPRGERRVSQLPRPVERPLRPLQGELNIEPKQGGSPIPTPKTQEPTFGYTLSGVIVGARPAAVFRDAQGNQRLVASGGSLDGDSKVLGVEKGSVIVAFRGKTLRLSVGGNPSDK